MTGLIENRDQSPIRYENLWLKTLRIEEGRGSEWQSEIDIDPILELRILSLRQDEVGNIARWFLDGNG